MNSYPVSGPLTYPSPWWIDCQYERDGALPVSKLKFFILSYPTKLLQEQIYTIVPE